VWLKTHIGDFRTAYEDPFGNTVVQAGTESAQNHHRFSTKYHDDETGSVYYGYRYNSTELGRWISRDPIEEDGGRNLYGSNPNDAINQIDDVGLRTVSGSMSETLDGINFTWNYGYDLKVTECKKTTIGVVDVTVRAKLQGVKVSAGLKTLYQEGVRQQWDNKFKLVCEECKCAGYLIRVKLVFVESGQDLTIAVNRGEGQGGVGAGALVQWGTSDPQGTAGHEIGHQLGNADEYGNVNGTDYGAGYQSNGGVMNNPENSALEKNFNSILQEASNDVKGENCRLVPVGAK
jgi:RHS repeat-associated protein